MGSAGTDQSGLDPESVNRDRTLKKEKPLEKVSGTGILEELVTAVSEDQTHGHIQAMCPREDRICYGR